MGMKETAITVAVAVLFSTFIIVAIDAVYPRPEYDDYCGNGRYFQPAMPVYDKQQPQVNCTYVQGKEESDCYSEGGFAVTDYDETGCPYYKECNFCNKEYEEASKKYSNTYLYILAPLGAIAIILGVFYPVEFLGTGFMFSGIFLMFFGTVQNFEHLGKFSRVIVVFAELLLVIFIAYKKIISQSQKEPSPPSREQKKKPRQD